MSSKSQIIYGTHAVLAAWQNPKRVCHKLFVTSKTATYLDKALPKHIKRPRPTIKDPQFFKSFFKEPTVHQNIILECASLEQPTLKQYLNQEKDKDLIIILDQVQDPQNLGAIIRTAVAFNAGAIILPEHTSSSITPIVTKIATGSCEHIPIMSVTNLNQAIDALKKEFYWVAAFAETGTQFLHEYNIAAKNVIIMGTEGKGIRPLILKNADTILKLPTSQAQSSINVSNATAIAIYEFSKKINF